MDLISLTSAKLGRLLYPLVLRLKKGFSFGHGLVVSGRPTIRAMKGGKITLGNDVTLNSNKRCYHASMFGAVKLVADKPGATITIGSRTRINGACIHAYSSINIGENCLIAANCQIFDENGHDLSFENPEARISTRGQCRPIIIHDNVWLGLNVIVMPGVTIGQGSVVAAGSVVTKDVPAMVLAGGVPARVIRRVELGEQNVQVQF